MSKIKNTAPMNRCHREGLKDTLTAFTSLIVEADMQYKNYCTKDGVQLDLLNAQIFSSVQLTESTMTGW